MPFMRDLFYWHGAAQPRTRIVRGKPVKEAPVGPDALAAILRPGSSPPSAVVIELTDPDWHAIGSAIPADEIIGTGYRNRRDGTWSGTFTGPDGNDVDVKDAAGATSMPSVEALALAARACHEEAHAAEAAILANPEALLERELSRHDWNYHYSDDHRVWTRGESHYDLIRELMRKVPVDRVRELWEKCAPSDQPFPKRLS